MMYALSSSRSRPCVGESSVVRRSNSWLGSALTLMGLLFVPCDGEAQSVGVQDVLEARIWFDRGDTPIVRQGDQVRIYYRASHDAYVAIFNIDTNGTSRLVFPRSPTEEHVVTGGRDYRLLFPRSPYWYVDDPPGLGYYFILASPEPFDFSGFDDVETIADFALSNDDRALAVVGLPQQLGALHV